MGASPFPIRFVEWVLPVVRVGDRRVVVVSGLPAASVSSVLPRPPPPHLLSFVPAPL